MTFKWYSKNEDEITNIHRERERKIKQIEQKVPTYWSWVNLIHMFIRQEWGGTLITRRAGERARGGQHEAKFPRARPISPRAPGQVRSCHRYCCLPDQQKTLPLCPHSFFCTRTLPLDTTWVNPLPLLYLKDRYLKHRPKIGNAAHRCFSNSSGKSVSHWCISLVEPSSEACILAASEAGSCYSDSFSWWHWQKGSSLHSDRCWLHTTTYM